MANVSQTGQYNFMTPIRRRDQVPQFPDFRQRLPAFPRGPGDDDPPSDDDDGGGGGGGGGPAFPRPGANQGAAQPAMEITMEDFTRAIADGFRLAQDASYETAFEQAGGLFDENTNVYLDNLNDFIDVVRNENLPLRERKQRMIAEFEKLGAEYIQYPNESNYEIIQRLDFIKKIKMQNEAYAALRTGEPIKLEKGFVQTSDFSQEKILSTAVNGSPTSKIIRFTNGISEVKIVPDGNGQYFGIQSGKRFGPGKFPDIERWAQRGGFEVDEKRELKNIMDAIKDPEKMKAVVFRARKL